MHLATKFGAKLMKYSQYIGTMRLKLKKLLQVQYKEVWRTLDTDIFLYVSGNFDKVHINVSDRFKCVFIGEKYCEYFQVEFSLNYNLIFHCKESASWSL